MGTSRSPISRFVAFALLANGCASPSPRDARPGTATPTAAAPLDAGAPNAHLADPQPPAGLRLGTTVRPTHESLELTIDPSQERYSGIATIDVTLAAATEAIWLHAVDLEIASAEVKLGEKVTPLRVLPGTFGRIGLAAAEALPAGAATMVITFRGTLDAARSRGIYREREGDVSYAYTFFEPVDARRGFPCFDEPSFKIPWTLTFHVRPGDVVAANTEVRTTSVDAAGLNVMTFATSKPLPSYLVAFIVGPFEAVPLKSGPNGRPIRIFVPKGRAPETRYAQEITANIVKILEDQIGVPYPYEKLDVAVVPRFWGTMEHAGLVALGQPLTLLKKSEETFYRKKRYANIAIHELAHHWFGDMVTTAWWDDTWLNESFASWADGKATNTFAPSWEMPNERLNNKQAAITADVLSTAKPVRVAILLDTDITASFDNTSTYYKGAAVLDMMEQWAGAARFRGTIASYLRAHVNGVATMADMADAMGQGLGPDAVDILHAFIEKPGIPVVGMSLTCAPGAAPRLHLSQARLEVAATPAGSWPIPICVRYGDSHRKQSHRTCQVLRDREGDMSLEGSTCPDWLVGQENGIGYYVVSAEKGLAARALAPASGATLIERLALAYDVRTLVRTGRASESDTLALLEPLVKIGKAPTYHFAADVLESSDYYANDADRDALAAYTRHLFEPLRARIGFTPPTEPALAMLQARVLDDLAQIGRSKETIATAIRLAGTWLTTHAGVDEELVGTVLRIAIASGDRAVYARARAAALASDTPREEQQRLFGVLGATPDPTLSADALALLLDTKVDLREAHNIVFSALSVRATREMAFDFFLTHAAEITGRMRDDDASGALQVAWWFCDSAHADRAEKALGVLASRIDGGALALHKSLERARSCEKTRDARAAALHQFLATAPK